MVFWALSLSPGKEYSQVVDMGFFVTMAALGLPAEAEEASGRKGGKRKSKSGASDAVAAPSTVMVRVENTDYMVCTLRAGTRDQQALSLKFSEGEEIAFTNLGDQVVHLTGEVQGAPLATAHLPAVRGPVKPPRTCNVSQTKKKRLRSSIGAPLSPLNGLATEPHGSAPLA